MSKFLWIIIDKHNSNNYIWPCIFVYFGLQKICRPIQMAITGYPIWKKYVNREKYFAISFLLELCIILHFRIHDMQVNSILRRGIPVVHTIQWSSISGSPVQDLPILQRVPRLFLIQGSGPRVAPPRSLSLMWYILHFQAGVN